MPAAARPEHAELTVFAAASLTAAFTEIGQSFEELHPNIAVTFNFAGSQQLATQLGQGAPADVFASANNAQMTVASAAGRVVTGSQHTFVYNRLVVIYPVDNPADLIALPDLAKPSLRLIIAAAAVPVGRYAQQFLDKAAGNPLYGADFRNDVLNNVVSFEQNVKAVLTKVALGEADAGIVYTSDVTADTANRVHQLEIPDELNTIAAYPVAVIDDAQYPRQAQDFIDYLLSPDGQIMLEKFGFMPALE